MAHRPEYWQQGPSTVPNQAKVMNQGQGAFRSSRRTRAPETRLGTKLQFRFTAHSGDEAEDRAAAQVKGSLGVMAGHMLAPVWM